MIWAAIIALWITGIIVAWAFTVSQRAQNRVSRETRTIAESAFTRVVKLEQSVDALHPILFTAEGVVCNFTEGTVSVMFANIHFPELDRKKKSYIVTIARLHNEPVHIGQCRVFILHAYGNGKAASVTQSDRPNGKIS